MNKPSNSCSATHKALLVPASKPASAHCEEKLFDFIRTDVLLLFGFISRFNITVTAKTFNLCPVTQSQTAELHCQIEAIIKIVLRFVRMYIFMVINLFVGVDAEKGFSNVYRGQWACKQIGKARKLLSPQPI